MLISKNKTENKIIKTVIYNSIIFFIILLWFFYSNFDNPTILILMSCFIALLILFSFIFNIKITNKISIKLFHILLILIPFSFLIDIIFFYEAYNPPVFISYNSLIGITLNNNLFLFLIYFGLTILKVLPIKLFNKRVISTFKNKEIDDYFEYFLHNFSAKKWILLLVLLPLGAFIEEFVFRCLLITIFVNYYHWSTVLVIFFIAFVFGFSHYSSSKNWLHFLSTFFSSIIYSLALIQLGLLYPWILHLTTNLLAILFFYQLNKRRTKG